MSIYAVNKVCQRIFHDVTFRDALAADVDGALAPFPLTAEEKRLLLAGEVGRLYEMGAHPFLLGHLTRHGTFGISVADYSRRMLAARDDRIPPIEAADWYKG